jgi:hypothetical protein
MSPVYSVTYLAGQDPLPLSPCGRGWINRAVSAIETGEGFVSAERDPHPPSLSRGHLLPQGEKEGSHRQPRTIIPGNNQRQHRARRLTLDRHRQEMFGPPLFAAFDQHLTRGARLCGQPIP